MTHAESSPSKTNRQEVSKLLGATDPRDLALPLYGATFGQAMTRFFRSYARFSGRASRSEYWWVMLAQTAAAGLLVCGVALGTESSLERMGVTVLIGFMLVWAIPAWALMVRRLHDADFSGWMALLAILPYIGSLMPIIFGFLPSKPRGECFDRR
ncbi:Inner membrane protein yhaH [Mycolicibacterium phlei]|uniref:DUF805 domain-containing protein n=1 Tax=Mycobacteroides chelonae TaxID=1774 RepID=UPI0006189D5F|nr:DUF805 domain-containing protein [Mycobacteroides chelonae]VEG18746.1 Inner membrane protein yhaH [Mycolicibacterium phlei]AKC39825.1 hypothetical protein GR01_16450 [Mycobacteroides chelonae]ANA99382.1 hypothetical protein BB28_17320 [Mycobacteroides chelonae CCUG 47445]OLT70805.1 DUF805 domain-containing protein [Mycobacteroides chelonae]ORV11206.1 hypothetical protein AWB96_24310 [Mycobacteroides chelonae]